jgi:cytochrome c
MSDPSAWPAPTTLGAFLLAVLMCMPAQASMNLALDKGCLSCHGNPPRGRAPTMAQLAQEYARFRGQESEVQRLSSRLREHHLFGGVQAHERLSAEEADRFVRWLVEGDQ